MTWFPDSNLGPNYSYSNDGIFVGNFPLAAAVPFTVQGQDFTLTSIGLAAWIQNNVGDVGGAHISVSIRTDYLGAPSNTSLDSWMLVPIVDTGATSTADHYLSASSTLNPVLVAGATYWFVLAGTEFTAWNFNSAGVSGMYSYPGCCPVNQDWSFMDGVPQGAFAVMGTATVPEPSPTLLMGIGVSLLAVSFRKMC